jgi:hypothetical protein
MMIHPERKSRIHYWSAFRLLLSSDYHRGLGNSPEKSLFFPSTSLRMVAVVVL